MNEVTAIPDRHTANLYAEAATVGIIRDEALDALEARAALEFTAYTLHHALPIERQGDTDPRAWQLREQRRYAAERLWLAVQAEREGRR